VPLNDLTLAINIVVSLTVLVLSIFSAALLPRAMGTKANERARASYVCWAYAFWCMAWGFLAALYLMRFHYRDSWDHADRTTAILLCSDINSVLLCVAGYFIRRGETSAKHVETTLGLAFGILVVVLFADYALLRLAGLLFGEQSRHAMWLIWSAVLSVSALVYLGRALRVRYAAYSAPSWLFAYAWLQVVAFGEMSVPDDNVHRPVIVQISEGTYRELSRSAKEKFKQVEPVVAGSSASTYSIGYSDLKNELNERDFVKVMSDPDLAGTEASVRLVFDSVVFILLAAGKLIVGALVIQHLQFRVGKHATCVVSMTRAEPLPSYLPILHKVAYWGLTSIGLILLALLGWRLGVVRETAGSALLIGGATAVGAQLVRKLRSEPKLTTDP
jgi:hypothetical protein